MILDFSEVLSQFSARSGVSLKSCESQSILEISRGGLRIEITVPKSDVLIWYINIFDGELLAVEEWCDYEGYDETPKERLAVTMSSDIETFIVGILNLNLRLTTRPPTKIGMLWSKLKLQIGMQSKKEKVLEWQIDGVWQEAVPLYDLTILQLDRT